MALISSSCRRVVVGLGKTGMSCVRYLARKGLPFSVVDSRQHPPGLDELSSDYPRVPVFAGGFKQDILNGADELIISPGVALAQPEIAEAIAGGVKVAGDIELFFRAVGDTPVVAITGSNGKSTVTTLLGLMAEEAGINVAVGGNIGIPALELLAQKADLYILELSSFQLETTDSMQAAAATVLNMSPDHMDRYPSPVEYHAAKQRVYKGCKVAVHNLDDPLTAPLLPASTPAITFSGRMPDIGQYGLEVDKESGCCWLVKGTTRLLDTSEMLMVGQHNYMNALAALALGEAVGLELEPMLNALRRFPGLPHRCQWVAQRNQVNWFNDSKATNVGACTAAINGLGTSIAGKIVLIAGGDGKGADFSELCQPVSRYVRRLVLIGRDASIIESQLSGSVAISRARTLADAVAIGEHESQPGDAVLLAPACASFDMFKSFEHRGDEFCKLVVNRLKESAPC
ncbi:UDP-N-acetylmuramoyl-L-alanine--D-glutamate ligase [Endozoicomonas sp. Mp262]|uniref:UDP-N-acetylmuramoyl-L-alanine--D-glutamate ligase n=1 Tax=Endozoicomonas sp. Mp262 TaxID=2919499 RepID=UPI0021DA3E71